MDNKKNKERDIHDQREELVVKSNTLIRNVRSLRYDLSITEQKLIIYLVSKLCAEDKDFKKVKFSVAEFCDVCGIQKSGREYERVKSSIKQLRDKSYWIKNENEEILFAWIDTAKIVKYEQIELILSEALRPYLLELRKNFTSYQLINVLCLKSKYSIRLYEIFKSYLWIGKWEVNINEFREMIYLNDKYKLYKELKRNVIEPSIAEINKYTDLTIEYETLKVGRNVDKLVFKIIEKRGYQMTWELLLNQDERMKLRERQ